MTQVFGSSGECEYWLRSVDEDKCPLYKIRIGTHGSRHRLEPRPCIKLDADNNPIAACEHLSSAYTGSLNTVVYCKYKVKE